MGLFQDRRPATRVDRRNRHAAVPIIGVYSSHLILDEQVGANEIIALILVVSALCMVLLVPAWQRSRKAKSS